MKKRRIQSSFFLAWHQNSKIEMGDVKIKKKGQGRARRIIQIKFPMTA